MANIYNNEDTADIADNINSIALNLIDICKSINKTHAKFIYDGETLVNINNIIAIENASYEGYSYICTSLDKKIYFKGTIENIIEGIEILVKSDKIVEEIF